MSNCIEIYNHVQPTKELEIIYMKNDKKTHLQIDLFFNKICTCYYVRYIFDLNKTSSQN